MTRSRSDTSFTLLAAMLFLLLAVAAMLFLVLVRAPADRAIAELSEPQAVACPQGSHAPVCYEVVLTNVGSGGGRFGCRAYPADGTSAVFSNGASIYVTPTDSPVAENQGVTLTLLTGPLGGKDIVGTPRIDCDAIS